MRQSQSDRVQFSNIQSKQTERILFVFLEIFSCEGGIQTYVKDILSSYQVIVQQAARSGKIYHTDIVLLRDSQACNNPFDTKLIANFKARRFSNVVPNLAPDLAPDRTADFTPNLASNTTSIKPQQEFLARSQRLGNQASNSQLDAQLNAQQPDPQQSNSQELTFNQSQSLGDVDKDTIDLPVNSIAQPDDRSITPQNTQARTSQNIDQIYSLDTSISPQAAAQNSPTKTAQSASAFQFYYLKTRQPNLGRLRCVMRLFWQCLMHRPTQIICGHVNLAPLVRSLSQLFKIPYVVMTYGKEVWQPIPPAQQQALAHADAIWTISRYSRDQAAMSNQLDRDRFQMLPCVINGNTFYPAPKPQILLDRYQLHGARVLMTVARLWSGDIYKGVDVTLRALPEICRVFPDVKYLIIGRGDDRPRLEQLAADLGVADRVVFAGFVPTEELPDHYRVADAYVMPSQEGFGIVYLEAMATGIPVLSGDNDGSADPLQDGRLGWQVPHRDPQAVAQACIEMLRGTDRRCDGNWLRAETLAAFSHAAIADRLRSLLHR